MEIIFIRFGLLVGLIFSWVLNLKGGDIFIWRYCLFPRLKVVEIILSDEDKNGNDLSGGILIPDFQGI